MDRWLTNHETITIDFNGRDIISYQTPRIMTRGLTILEIITVIHFQRFRDHLCLHHQFLMWYWSKTAPSVSCYELVYGSGGLDLESHHILTMATEMIPETSVVLNQLGRLMARDFISAPCRHIYGPNPSRGLVIHSLLSSAWKLIIEFAWVCCLKHSIKRYRNKSLICPCCRSEGNTVIRKPFYCDNSDQRNLSLGHCLESHRIVLNQTTQ
jgi:hypothetical protein